MEMVNGLYRIKESDGVAPTDEWRFAIESLLQILAPFAPHITEELWSQLGHSDTIHVDHWPQWDDVYLQSATMTIVVQVNGKVRGKLTVPSEMSCPALEKLALSQEKVAEWTDGKTVVKVISVPGKLVNIVVK